MAEVKVKAPVQCGQIICSNILKKNIKIVASRNMKKKEP
jgi:CxxC motif-containing protein